MKSAFSGNRIALVGNRHDLDFDHAARRLQFDLVAFPGFHQRPCDGRNPAYFAVFQAGLVDTYDAHGFFIAPVIGVGHRRPEEYLIAVFLLGLPHHCGDFDAFNQESKAAVNLAQPFLAIDIIAVFRAIPVARRP